MAEAAFSLSVAFERVTCCACGVPFAAPRELLDKRRETHKDFFCPNGHNLHFPGETEAERLKKLLDDEAQRHSRTLARLNTTEQRARKAERKLKRVARGVCPCCNRTFENLARHMATKHPDQVPECKPAA